MHSPGNVANNDRVILPANIPASYEKLKSFGIYLIDDGDYINLFIMNSVQDQIISQLIGKPRNYWGNNQKKFEKSNNKYNKKIYNIIRQLR